MRRGEEVGKKGRERCDGRREERTTHSSFPQVGQGMLE